MEPDYSSADDNDDGVYDSLDHEIRFYFSQAQEELRRKIENQRLLKQKEEAKAKMEREERVSIRYNDQNYPQSYMLPGSKCPNNPSTSE